MTEVCNDAEKSLNVSEKSATMHVILKTPSHHLQFGNSHHFHLFPTFHLFAHTRTLPFNLSNLGAEYREHMGMRINLNQD